MAAPESLAGAIGERLRRLRKDRDLTLKALAARAGFSEALLSRIERGQVATTVANLASLAEALGVTLAALLETPAPDRPPYSLTRAGDGQPMQAGSYLYRPLCPGMPAPLSALLVAYGPRMPEDWLTHPGTELLYVVSGRLRFELDQEVLELAAGDCLLFDAALPHRACSLEEQPAETLMVLDRRAPAPPSA